MNIRPTNDKLVIERDAAKKMTDGGLHLPEEQKDEPKSGVVIAAGPGRFNIETCTRLPMSIAVGDRVLFDRHSGSEVEVDGKKLLVMTEDCVLAVLESQ